ncbi:MAG TPA: DUF1080 domain-containing protein [Candidatus Hydrogenedentes bacterium]|nr:DUF1080 domain-containing protein [Candidatus Hydrogenedentota bacterium]
MKQRILLRYLVLFTSALLVSLPATADDLDALLAEFPAETPESAAALTERLLERGPEAIAALCDRLVATGAGEDHGARCALTGTAGHVMQPGREEQRLLFVGTVLNALATQEDDEIRAYLVELLRLAGKDECVGPLARLLTDPALCDPAARALSSIGTDAAGRTLLDALPTVQGIARLSVINALSTLVYAPAAAALSPLAASDDLAVREAALDAIARIAPAEAGGLLESRTHDPDPAARSRAMARCLVYAEHRAAEEDIATCRRICADLLARGAEDAPEHIVCGALAVAAKSDLEEAGALLIAAMERPERSVRLAALEIVAGMPGTQVSERWIAELRTVRPEVRPEIVAMLGRRGDRVARNALIDALNAEDPVLRLAAIEALPRFGGPRVVEALVDRMKRAEAQDEVNALREALLQFPESASARRIGAALNEASPVARKALLEVLAARRTASQADAVFRCVADADDAVRLAALKALSDVAGPADLDRVLAVLLEARDDKERDAAVRAAAAVALQIEDAGPRVEQLLGALSKTSGEGRGRVLAVLPRIDGGGPALDAVVARTTDGDPVVRQAALRALADWERLQALGPIIETCRANTDPAARDMLLRGYARLVRGADRSEGKKLQLLADAIAATETADERRIFMSEVNQYRTVAALRILAGFLDDAALREDAAAAMARMACPRDEKDAGLRAHAVASALEKALPFLGDEGLREKAQAHIAAMPQADAEGFAPLFNGVDLAGWTGDVTGYAAENGAIVCTPTSRGNLYTDLDYADFVLRFEFRLTSGANNGVGIRTPLYGHAAYDGMEIQVLDDSAPEYADLKPYQAHGSIYGVVPAERGHLKPVGEWNAQEITAKGTRITVTLNGAPIVDTDLEQFRNQPTPDEKAHPGLFNPAGRIAFLGHGAQVEFRNIRIKELE